MKKYGPIASKFYNNLDFINFDALSRWGTISPEDLKIFKFADSPQRAFSIIKKV
ncbi:MAG: hypothetical protein MK025_11245 [Acidobacteriia bacterium]|nr:hypothetical protein [Terriglobia bacterium]